MFHFGFLADLYLVSSVRYENAKLCVNFGEICGMSFREFQVMLFGYVVFVLIFVFCCFFVVVPSFHPVFFVILFWLISAFKNFEMFHDFFKISRSFQQIITQRESLSPHFDGLWIIFSRRGYRDVRWKVESKSPHFEEKLKKGDVSPFFFHPHFVE